MVDFEPKRLENDDSSQLISSNLMCHLRGMLDSNDLTAVNSSLREIETCLNAVYNKLWRSESKLDERKSELLTLQLQLIRTLQHVEKSRKERQVVNEECRALKTRLKSIVATEVKDAEDFVRRERPDLFRRYTKVNSVCAADKMSECLWGMEEPILRCRQLVQHRRERFMRRVIAAENSTPKSSDDSASSAANNHQTSHHQRLKGLLHGADGSVAHGGVTTQPRKKRKRTAPKSDNGVNLCVIKVEDAPKPLPDPSGLETAL